MDAELAPAQGLGGVARSLLRAGHGLGAQMKPNKPKVLVVFFSRSGTTRLLAEHIARAADADIEELRERRSRRGILGWLRSAHEGIHRRATRPLPLGQDPRGYDLVFVGSPTWSRSIASPVRGFLQEYSRFLQSVALFATCAGGGATDVIAQMTEFLKAPPLAVLAMLEVDVKRSASAQAAELTESALCAWEAQHPQQRQEGSSAAI
jgi:flavodoxin